MNSLLHDEAILGAAHELYCTCVASRLDELGLCRSIPREWDSFLAMVEPLDPTLQASIMWRWIGRTEAHWQIFDLGLALYHADFREVADQQRVLYYLFIGCSGAGVSLADHDDIMEALERANQVLNCYKDQPAPYGAHPFDCEFEEWSEAAEEAYPDGTTEF